MVCFILSFFNFQNTTFLWSTFLKGYFFKSKFYSHHHFPKFLLGLKKNNHHTNKKPTKPKPPHPITLHQINPSKLQACTLYNSMYNESSVRLSRKRGSFHKTRAESFQSYLKPPHLLFGYKTTEQPSGQHEYQRFYWTVF